MTTETLLPFDLETAIAHPERVRWIEDSGRDSGRRASKVGEFDGWVLVKWMTGEKPYSYDDIDINYRLRLVGSEPERVRVRVAESDSGLARHAFLYYDGDEPPLYHRWASDPVEIPLYPQEDA